MPLCTPPNDACNNIELKKTFNAHIIQVKNYVTAQNMEL